MGGHRPPGQLECSGSRQGHNQGRLSRHGYSVQFVHSVALRHFDIAAISPEVIDRQCFTVMSFFMYDWLTSDLTVVVMFFVNVPI